jgi:hypothetical protein
MSEMKLLFQVSLRAEHKPTGRTRHYRGHGELPAPKSLSIGQFDNDPGFYLFYLDRDGREQTDTYHETLEDAFQQAQREFGIERSDWVEVPR